jgi:hypothetical protein
MVRLGSMAMAQEGRRMGPRPRLAKGRHPAEISYGGYVNIGMVLKGSLFATRHYGVDARAKSITKTHLATTAPRATLRNKLGDASAKCGEMVERSSEATEEAQDYTYFGNAATMHYTDATMKDDDRVQGQMTAVAAAARFGSSLALTSRRPPRPTCAWIPVAPRHQGPAT